MTTGESAQEVPFLSGMEKEPPGVCETTVTVGRKLFRLDGMVDRLLEKARMAMGMSDPERGPADYDAFADERRFYQALLRERNGGSRNNGDGGSTAWQKWLVTLCGGLALMGVGGGIVMYGKLSAIEANQVSQQRQLDQLAGTVANLRRAP